MKKFTSALWALLLAMPLLFISCEANDADGSGDANDTNTSSNGSYSGLLTITGSSDDNSTFVEDQVFKVTVDEDNSTLSITMVEVSFMPGYMPEQTMDLVDLKYIQSGTIKSVSESSVIPQIDGVPYDDYTLSTVVVAEDSSTGQLAVSFNCMGYQVTYLSDPSL